MYHWFLILAVVLTGLSSANSDDAIKIYDWPFGKDVFEIHEKSFEEKLGHDIEFKQLDFPIAASIETAFLYQEPIDLVGMLSSSVYRLAEAGWVEDLSNYPEAVRAVNEMYSNVSQAVRHDGLIYGVGQAFTGVAVPLVDMNLYSAAGYSRQNFPTNWSSLSDQIVDIAAQGNQYFYLPYWFNDPAGLPLGFTAEVLNRGGFVVDPKSDGVYMQIDRGPAYDTLVDWRRILRSGAVNPKVLEMSHPEFDRAFMQGDYMLSAHKTDALLLASEKKVNGHKISIIPSRENNWGSVGAEHFGLVARNGESEGRKKAKIELLILNTRGKDELEYSVSEQWLKERGYFSVFKKYMESDAAQKIIRSKLSFPSDAPVLMHIVENLDYPVGEWGVIWKYEFYDYMASQLRIYLENDELPPSWVIHNLNKKILYLRTLYGF